MYPSLVLEPLSLGSPSIPGTSFGFNSGIHNRMGLPKARIEERVPVVDSQPSRVGEVGRQPSERMGILVLGIASLGGSVLASSPSSGTPRRNANRFQVGMRSLASPVLESVIAAGEVSTTQPDAVSRLFRGTRPGVGGNLARRRRRDHHSRSQPPRSPRFPVIESSSVRADRAPCEPMNDSHLR